MAWPDSDPSTSLGTCFLKAMFEASPDAMYVKDLGLTYVAMNPAGARFIGKPLTEILGRTDHGVFEAPTADRIQRTDRRILEERETVTYEETAGARTYSNTRGPLISSDGSVCGLFGISRDLQREKLVALAYDLRDPLGTIANAVSALSRGARGHDAELLAIIAEETARAQAAVGELLDFRPNLSRAPQLLLRLFDSSQPVVK